MVVGGFYALGDWWLRNRDGAERGADPLDVGLMWLGLGRMQEGERWDRRRRREHAARMQKLRLTSGPPPADGFSGSIPGTASTGFGLVESRGAAPDARSAAA